MNLKLVPVLLAIAVTPVVIPLVAKAELNRPVFAVKLAQAPFANDFGEELGLTPQQKEQLTQLSNSRRSQIESVLSPQQQQQFATIREQGQQMRQAFQQLNLTAEQKTKIREIFQSSRTEVAKILTPEQQQKLRQKIQAGPLWRKQNP
jgi:periplasmic protein CpxP/Spy